MTTRARTIYRFGKEGKTDEDSSRCRKSEVVEVEVELLHQHLWQRLWRGLWKRGNNERHKSLRNDGNGRWRWNEEMSTIKNRWKCCSL